MERVLANHPFTKKVLTARPKPATDELQSVKVKICNINNYEREFSEYSKWKKEGRGRIIGVGGPAAIDQTLMSCLIPSIRESNDVNFYCRNYAESNYVYSAMQNHVRHSTSYNSERNKWGIFMFPKIMKQRLFKPRLADLETVKYERVNVTLNSLKLWRIYLGYELNAYKNEVLRLLNRSNEPGVNKIEGALCQAIQEEIEKKEGIKLNNVKAYDGPDRTRTIELYEKSFAEMEKTEPALLKDLDDAYAVGYPLEHAQHDGPEAVRKYFPDQKGFNGCREIYGESSSTLDVFYKIKETTTKLGAVWKDDATVTEVFVDVDKATGRPFVCGVRLDSGEFIPANAVHLTLGYKGKVEYEGSAIPPLKTEYSVGTAVSLVLVIKKTPQIQQVLREHGKIIETNIKNIHYTHLVDDQEHILVRQTSGGFSGNECYSPEVVLNLLCLSKKLFGESFVGLYNAYGCCRTLNARNATEMATIA